MGSSAKGDGRVISGKLLVRFMGKDRAQSGWMRTFIQPGPISGVHFNARLSIDYCVRRRNTHPSLLEGGTHLNQANDKHVEIAKKDACDLVAQYGVHRSL